MTLPALYLAATPPPQIHGSTNLQSTDKENTISQFYEP